jgi:hypothetical protein
VGLRGDDLVRYSLLATVAALLAGVAVRALTVWFRDHGPSWGSVALDGNGALVFLLLAPLAIVVLEVWCYRRGARLGMLLVPLAVLAGTFVLGGGV